LRSPYVPVMDKTRTAGGKRKPRRRGARVLAKALGWAVVVVLVAGPPVLHSRAGIGISPILTGSMRPFADPGHHAGPVKDGSRNQDGTPSGDEGGNDAGGKTLRSLPRADRGPAAP
jgi:hypothetical protein